MKLIIYNNTARLSTVLKAFLDETSKDFEKIHIIFPGKYDAEKDYGAFDGNVDYMAPSVMAKVKAFFAALCELFGKETLADFRVAREQKKFNMKFLLKYVKKIYCAKALYNASLKILGENNGENTAVFSTWYEANAIAAAYAAKRYPGLFAASYAHSYEVDFRKNRYTLLIRDRFKEKYLKEVYFISRMVMDEYIELNKNYLEHTDKYIPVHFGCKKKREGLSKASEDGTLRIATCSGISPVKRLDILAEALCLYDGKVKIEWTVLGNGPDMEKVKAITDKFDETKVSAIFKGNVANDQVHDYYAENVVDLFINVSKSEGLPVSIMEAMAYGIPALATNAGGNHEIVTKETGYPIPLDITPETLSGYIKEVAESVDKCREKRNAAYEMWDNGYRIAKNVKIVSERLKSNGKN